MMKRRNRKKVLTTLRKRTLSYRIRPLQTLAGSSKMTKIKKVGRVHSLIYKTSISKWKRKKRSIKSLPYHLSISSSNKDKLLSISIK